jgi:hypothetical protein
LSKNNLLKRNWLQQGTLLSIPNHKLYKNAYLENIHSVVQKIMVSQTTLTVLAYYVTTPYTMFPERRGEFSLVTRH